MKPSNHTPEPRMEAPNSATRSTVRELFDCRRAENEADVREAEQRAVADGKQLFAREAFEQLMGRGPQNEAELRMAYYIRHPEFRTMAEFAKYLHDIAPWEDSR